MLADVTSVRHWTVTPYPDGDGWAVGMIVQPSEDGVHKMNTLHKGTEDDCRSFFKSLAVRLGAVKWNAAKRHFAAVTYIREVDNG
jgi:hypothetical protein